MRISLFSWRQYCSSIRIIILFGMAAGLVYCGCGDLNVSENPPPLQINPTVEFVEHSGCTLIGGKSADNYEKCIALEYDGSGELKLTSISSDFNCCPDSLEGTISFNDHTISIVETEYVGPMSGCDCYCPYDFAYQISDIPPGVYTINIEILPLIPDDYLVTFEVTLLPSAVTDTLCQDISPQW